MKHLRIAALAAMLLLVAAVLPLSAQQEGIEGKWNIVLGQYGGNKYDGTIEFEPSGNQFNVRWQVTEGTATGAGIFEGGRLYVGWGTTEAHGIVVYTVESDGSLTGRWTLSGNDGSLGTERAIGGSLKKKSTFTVQGTNPGSGAPYEGKLTIWKLGEVYQFQWEIGDDTFMGTGLRFGDKLAVGWGRGEGEMGIASYLFNGDKADGNWAIPGDKTVGIENLERVRTATTGR